MRILLATDAWLPQVNGVARTLSKVISELKKGGDEIFVLEPSAFPTIPLPTYPEIRIAITFKKNISALINSFRPDAVHIATEGPIGLATRLACLRQGLPFTTGFHTRFPEYIHARFGLPIRLGYLAIRRFHSPSTAVMVPTAAVARDLKARGFSNIKVWTRGVDTTLFCPNGLKMGNDLERPIFLNVGRVSIEKNLSAFLSLNLPGSKVIVGDGPARRDLSNRFPEAYFVGEKFGEELAAWHRSADVFVFPSKSDTFGLVMLEALASGVPVAAFPVMGPIDVIGKTPVGVLNQDLKIAALKALSIPKEPCVTFARRHTWEETARLFRSWLAQIEFQ